MDEQTRNFLIIGGVILLTILFISRPKNGNGRLFTIGTSIRPNSDTLERETIARAQQESSPGFVGPPS